MFLGVKKSLYLFLCSILGVFLFLILHRLGVFLYLYFIASSNNLVSFNYFNFLMFDYFTLILALMLGAWYGIWLGLYWFEKVYEESSHGGLAEHIGRHFWSGTSPKNLELKVANIKERLEKDLWQLEDLAENAVSVKPQPKVRRVVRKRAPKKFSKAG